MSEKEKLKSSIKHPTSLVVGGDDFLAVEIVKSLVEQGGYVIVIDHDNEKVRERYEPIENKKLLSIIDYSAVEFLEDDLRRLDYVFYLAHKPNIGTEQISSQEFLQASNYLDLIIKLTNKYRAKFLLSTSIKAHKVLIERGDLEANFGPASKDTHAVYTQLEIQRYSEALVKESIEKMDLDARTVRIGKIIGEGMEFDLNDNFDRLVYQAVKAKDLEVRGDGLETNQYVHVLDAAYGVIKAMFSKGTHGEIFSIANQEEITDLSIAYKLVELTGSQSEIKFKSTKDSLPPLRYHKPARNLGEKGWSPRISFLRALKQVIDYMIQLETNYKQDIESLDIAEEDLVDNDKDEKPKGALARLIAERKSQEKARKGSILMANQKARNKAKTKRRLSPGTKIQRWIERRYDSFTLRMSFLKRVTIAEGIFYLVFITMFAIIYIEWISPAFIIGKNIFLTEYYYNQLEQDIEEHNIKKVSENLSKINDAVSEISHTLDNFEIIYDVFEKDQEFEDLYSYINSLSLYINSLNEAVILTEDFDSYMDANDTGLIYRPNSDSLLAVSDSGSDTISKEVLLSNKNRYSQVQEKIDMTRELLDSQSAGNLFGYDLKSLVEKSKSYEQEISMFLGLVDKYSSILLDGDLRTYAIVIQDNSRYTPGGGYPASLGFVQLKDGEIINLSLSPIKEDTYINRDLLKETEVSEINIASSGFIDKSQINFDDLFLVRDRSKIIDNIGDTVSVSQGVEVDAVVFINLQTMAKLLDTTGSISLNQVNIDSNTLLSSITLLQAGDGSLERRNEIISNIFAQQIIGLANDKYKLYNALSVISRASEQKSILLETENPEIREIVTSDESNILLPENWIQIAAAIDPKAQDISVFPSINVKIDDQIDSDLKILRTVELFAGNTQNLERIVVCIPPSASGFDFSESKLSLGQTFSQNEICVSGDFDNSKRMAFSYVIRHIENTNANEYNMESAILSSPGIQVSYDLQITPSDGIYIQEEVGVIISNGRLISSGVIEGDKIIDYTLKK